MEIIRRTQAAQAVIDTFYLREFEWGTRDCAHLAALALVRLGYDDPFFGTAAYSTPRGAKKALKRHGYESLEAYLDAHFEEIAPASALPADIIAIEADADGWVALGINIGHDRILAFANGIADWAPAHVCRKAWRVTPKPLFEGEA